MNDGTTLSRITSTELTPPREAREQLADDLVAALDEGRSMPPLHLYDDHGSALFERITQADEYYLTGAEAETIAREAEAIVSSVRPHEIVELASSSSIKAGALLSAMQRAGTGDRYAALDVSTAAPEEAPRRLAREHPRLRIDNYTGDFHTDREQVPRSGTRLLLFLGSTIGNMPPTERRNLLTTAAGSLRSGDGFLIGIDLVKDLDVLLPAYDDTGGVAAAFGLNLLRIIDRELDADIPLEAFVAELAFAAELASAELDLETVHTDTAQRFAIVLARPTAA